VTDIASRENVSASLVMIWPVAQDCDSVGDFQRFLQRVLMKTIDTIFLAQSVYQREEMMLFLRRQRRSRLVEDDDFRLESDGSGDFDHLPLGGAE